MPPLRFFASARRALRNMDATSHMPIYVTIAMGSKLVTDIVRIATSFARQDINQDTLIRDIVLDAIPLCLMAITLLVGRCRAPQEAGHAEEAKNKLIAFGALYFAATSSLNITDVSLNYADYSRSNTTNCSGFNQRESTIHLIQATLDLLYFCCMTFPALWRSCCECREGDDGYRLLEGGEDDDAAYERMMQQRLSLRYSNSPYSESVYGPLENLDSPDSNSERDDRLLRDLPSDAARAEEECSWRINITNDEDGAAPPSSDSLNKGHLKRRRTLHHLPDDVDDFRLSVSSPRSDEVIEPWWANTGESYSVPGTR